MFDLLTEIRQTLRSNRTRTFLTGISVSWGIFMLILLVGMARGLINNFEGTISARKPYIEVWGGYTTKPYSGYREGRYIQMHGADADAISEDHPQLVSSVTPRINVDTVNIIGTEASISGFTATTHDYDEVIDVNLVEGRILNARDLQENRRSMLLAKRNAERIFGTSTGIVGRTVKAMGLSWTVVGVYDHRWRSQTYVPYTTVAALQGGSDNITSLQIDLPAIESETEAESAENAFIGTLARRHEFDPSDHNAIWTWNSVKSFLEARTIFNILNIVTWIIGLFTMLSGIVGVSNIMFVSVRERIHEIGVRRAIGAKPRAILSQILSESVVITAVFGYIGLFFGMVLLQFADVILSKSENSPLTNPTVDIGMALQVTLVLILAGALAGLFPALKAIKVKPVEALRDE